MHVNLPFDVKTKIHHHYIYQYRSNYIVLLLCLLLFSCDGQKPFRLKQASTCKDNQNEKQLRNVHYSVSTTNQQKRKQKK